MKSIDVYEHDRLKIGDNGFSFEHWQAFVKLNTIHNGAYFEVLHNGLKFNEFVGVIQVDGLLVNIYPKADKDEENSKWKGVLLMMLAACGKIKAQDAGNASLRKQNINLLEVYFNHYLLELEQLIHNGLIKQYRKETKNVMALKGKLEFAKQISKNLIHKERFYTTHQVYDKNHLIHQVLNYALSIVNQFSKGTYLNDKSKRVQLSFPKIKKQIPTLQQINSIKITRKNAPYQKALDLAKFIIFNYSPDITSGKENMIALLFNMNELWEEYVLKQLKKYASENKDQNWIVNGQESKVFYGSRTIRPDIVLRKDNKTFVIDTKWKRPSNKSASIEDLRQMYAYGRFWQSEKLVLLYPGSKVNTNFKDFRNNIEDGVAHQCKVAFVSAVSNDRELNPDIAKEIFNIFKN